MLAVPIPASAGHASPVKKWRILGPFVIGKNDLDGEPWHLSNASELVPGGFARSQRLTAESDGNVKVDWPEVEWQSLVNSVGGHELLEWQALAQGFFKLSAAGTVLLSCKGVSAFHVDDRLLPFVGDQYKAGLPPHPVELEAGTHRLAIRLRAKYRAAIGCTVELGVAGAPPRLFGGQFLALPDVVEGVLPSDLLVLPAVNLHPTEWLREVRVVATGDSEVVLITAQPAHAPLAPGQAVLLAVRIALKAGAATASGCPHGRLRLVMEGRQAGTPVRSSPLTLPALRCRQRDQSFVFTFVDPDGSVQQAAAVMPKALEALESCGSGGCPVLITLHGTSISASDSADSYKVKTKGDTDYRFGVAGGWLLAPTRHGAHNWEGPGLSTALASLQALPGVAKQLGALAPDLNRIIIAGHSMGGHGAWLLALALRDAAVGLVSSASWLRKDQYSDSNRVFLHDVATPDVDPALAALLRAAEVEYDVEAHAATLAGGLRVLLRVGSQDTTVHPWFSRRMLRTLLAAGANASEVAFSEVAGKEHWWWDTLQPNDGGAVNDVELRAFYRECFSRAAGPAALPAAWRLVVHNPATSGSKGGLRVLQQLVPHRRSEVSVLPDHLGGIRLETANVRKLEWEAAAWDELVRTSCGQAAACGAAVVLDGEELPPPVRGTAATWCRAAGGRWGACQGGPGAAVERGPSTWGPMRRLFARRACAVLGARPGKGLEAATYTANLLVMTGHGHMPILEAAEVLDASGHLAPPEECEGLLIVGGPDDNAAAATLLRPRPEFEYEPPLGLAAEALDLGGCQWVGPGVAVLALLPWWRRGGHVDAAAPARAPVAELALLVAGATSPGAAGEALALLSTPTIPPMTRQPLTHLLPDYVVLDVSATRARGAGGFLAAGFWSHSWKHEPRASWEGACRTPAAAEGSVRPAGVRATAIEEL